MTIGSVKMFNVKIVSVMTTDSSGGAEFAAVEMLEALRQRGHETVMLTDMPKMARDTQVSVSPIALGPKLSTRSWIALAARWPLLLSSLRRALRAQAPYDVLMVHYKKEQLLAGKVITAHHLVMAKRMLRGIATTIGSFAISIASTSPSS